MLLLLSLVILFFIQYLTWLQQVWIRHFVEHLSIYLSHSYIEFCSFIADSRGLESLSQHKRDCLATCKWTSNFHVFRHMFILTIMTPLFCIKSTACLYLNQYQTRVIQSSKSSHDLFFDLLNVLHRALLTCCVHNAQYTPQWACTDKLQN